MLLSLSSQTTEKLLVILTTIVTERETTSRIFATFTCKLPRAFVIHQAPGSSSGEWSIAPLRRTLSSYLDPSSTFTQLHYSDLW